MLEERSLDMLELMVDANYTLFVPNNQAMAAFGQKYRGNLHWFKKESIITLLKWEFTAEVALMHPKKIVQSKLKHRLAKAVSELALHYFLFHLAQTHEFTNIVDLLYSCLSKIKYNIE